MQKTSSKEKVKIFPIKTIFKYYWQSLRPYKRQVILVFLGYGIANILNNVLQPLIFRHIVDTVSSGVSDRALVSEELWRWFWYFFFMMVVYNTLYRISDFAFTNSIAVRKHLMDHSFSDLSRHSYRFFSDTFSGSLVAKSKRYVASFEALFEITLFSFWLTAVQTIGMLIALFFIAPSISFITLIFCVSYVWFSWWLMKKKSPHDEQTAQEDSNITARFSDIISNILTVKTFSAEKKEQESFGEASSLWLNARKKSWYLENIIVGGQAILLASLEVLAVGISIRLWLRGEITSGTVVLVQWYMATIFYTLFGLNRVFGRYVRSIADASEMIEIFETPTEVSDKDEIKKIENVRGELAFDNVTFRYENTPVFENFSLRFNAGEKVGIVGASGSGKSTLTKLLLRFVDSQSGLITLDGVEISELSQADLRKHIAYVSQEPSLFHRSLRENIAYGKPDATEEEIIEAAKKAHAHEFISKLEKGYDTLVGERGVKLSGGERQRVAIARAILKDAPILILDEATSALDTISEKLIQQALDELMKNKTVIVIAHRLSTVRKMDRIIVMDQGTIVEEGSHNDLVAKDGVYANLWKHQTDGFID